MTFQWHVRGTAVAQNGAVRTMFLAWVILALVLLGLGRLTHAAIARARSLPAVASQHRALSR